MKLTWDDLTISPKWLDFEELMQAWRWLVDDSFSPVLLSALGDFFLADADGAVYSQIGGTAVGYYMRVFSKGAEPAKISAMRERLAENGLKAQVLTDNVEDQWDSAVLAHPDGREFAAIERNPVTPGALGAEELTEMIDEVSECEPASAAGWLKVYLSSVKTIYAFQVLSAADDGDGWEAIRTAMDACQDHAGGIRQADGEGFSNEDGFHILWQFSDKVSGLWWMAVLDDNEQWIPYQMDLGNKRHRKAFQQGRVPDGVSPSKPDEAG